jgi:hypothetical protein
MPDKRISAASEGPFGFKTFDMSPERGFLPASDPTPSRPAEFAPWQELGAELSKRLLAGRVASAVDHLPRLCVGACQTDGDHRAAMRILSCIAPELVRSLRDRNRRHPLYVPTRKTSRRNRIRTRARRGMS